MRILLIICLSSIGLALANSYEITGKAEGFYQEWEPSVPVENKLKVNADLDAQRQCSESLRIERISPYEVEKVYGPFGGFRVFVQATYLCQ